MMNKYTSYAAYIQKSLPKLITKTTIWKDEIILHSKPEYLRTVILYLRDHKNCQFKQISDLTVVDYPSRENRFEVVYNLTSYTTNNRLRLKIDTDEFNPVPSITDLHSSANWFEREAWDLFGVRFSGHPDLRRILTDYGFEGHPFRKDFPMTGYVECRYDEEKKRVVTEPLEMTQEFRKFNFDSSEWK